MQLFDYVNILPEELVKEIYNYISLDNKYLLNKDFYEKKINKNIDILSSIKYVKKIIRFDYDFIFRFVLNRNIVNWSTVPWKIKYKDYKFSNILDLISHICIESKSTRCRNLLIQNIKKKGNSKKKFKKIRRRNNRWSN